MKTFISIAVLTFTISLQSFSASYEETMKTNIQKITGAKTTAEFTTLAGQFERIAHAEPDKWLPGYYAAFCYVNAVASIEMKPDEKHKLLDVAQNKLDALLKSFTEESEIYALQSFVYQLRITDMSKGFKYTGMSFEALEKAEKLNPENPRVYYLRGTNTFHMPKAFGGGKEKAKPLFEKAAGLYENQNAVTTLKPSWGSEHNKKMLADCNSNGE